MTIYIEISLRRLHEIEENQKITFLNVLITPTRDKKLETTVFRKETNTDLYINRNSHAHI